MNFFGDYDWGSPGSILDYLDSQGAEDPNFQGMPVGTTALALAGALYGGKTLYDAYNAGTAASAASAPAGAPVGTPGPAGGPVPGGGAGPAGGPAGGPEPGAASALSKMSPFQLMQLGQMGTGMMGRERAQMQPPGVVGPRQPRPAAPFYSIGQQQGQDMRGLLY